MKDLQRPRNYLSKIENISFDDQRDAESVAATKAAARPIGAL
jgi:hypothetical protein